MEYFGISDKGKREKNEDSYLADKIGSWYVFAVADGMGGHAGGEIASKLAIIELEETIKRENSSNKSETLKKAIEKANEEIYLQSEESADKRGMGTTLVACVLDDKGEGVIANVGDSRAYLINNGIWHTKDHSYVQELLDSGIIDENEARNHPRKNILTRALGIEKEVSADFYDVVLGGKVLLLSSDGLHDYLPNEEIAEIVRSFNDLEEACKTLINGALLAGSGDNITALAVRF